MKWLYIKNVDGASYIDKLF